MLLGSGTAGVRALPVQRSLTSPGPLDHLASPAASPPPSPLSNDQAGEEAAAAPGGRPRHPLLRLVMGNLRLSTAVLLLALLSVALHHWQVRRATHEVAGHYSWSKPIRAISWPYNLPVSDPDDRPCTEAGFLRARAAAQPYVTYLEAGDDPGWVAVHAENARRLAASDPRGQAHPYVVLTPRQEGRHLDARAVEVLAEAGAAVVSVSDLCTDGTPEEAAACSARANPLHLFGMTQWTHAVYLSRPALVRGPLHHLFGLETLMLVRDDPFYETSEQSTGPVLERGHLAAVAAVRPSPRFLSRWNLSPLPLKYRRLGLSEILRERLLNQWGNLPVSLVARVGRASLKPGAAVVLLEEPAQAAVLREADRARQARGGAAPMPGPAAAAPVLVPGPGARARAEELTPEEAVRRYGSCDAPLELERARRNHVRARASRQAWASYLSTDADPWYVESLRMMYHQMARVCPEWERRDFVVMVPPRGSPDVSEASRARMLADGMILHEVEQMDTLVTAGGRMAQVWGKLRVWSLTRYDKVAYLDPDQVLRDVCPSSMFDFPATTLYMAKPDRCATGVLVVEPGEAVAADLSTKAALSCVPDDQAFTCAYFGKDAFYIPPWFDGYKRLLYYNSPYVPKARRAEARAFVKERALFWHFAGAKPWQPNDCGVSMRCLVAEREFFRRYLRFKDEVGERLSLELPFRAHVTVEALGADSAARSMLLACAAWLVARAAYLTYALFRAAPRTRKKRAAFVRRLRARAAELRPSRTQCSVAAAAAVALAFLAYQNRPMDQPTAGMFVPDGGGPAKPAEARVMRREGAPPVDRATVVRHLCGARGNNQQLVVASVALGTAEYRGDYCQNHRDTLGKWRAAATLRASTGLPSDDWLGAWPVPDSGLCPLGGGDGCDGGSLPLPVNTTAAAEQRVGLLPPRIGDADVWFRRVAGAMPGRGDEFRDGLLPSCAVVENGRSVLGHGHGERVDSHSLVFRVGAARVDGFEQNVGVKTGVRIVRSEEELEQLFGGAHLPLGADEVLVVAAESRRQAESPGTMRLVSAAAAQLRAHGALTVPGKEIPRLFVLDLALPCLSWDMAGVGKSPAVPPSVLLHTLLALSVCERVEVFGTGWEVSGAGRVLRASAARLEQEPYFSAPRQELRAVDADAEMVEQRQAEWMAALEREVTGSALILS